MPSAEARNAMRGPERLSVSDQDNRPDCRPCCISACQYFTCSKDESLLVITSLSNWGMFWFNVLCMITDLHLKSGNYCVCVHCVCVKGISFHRRCAFFFPPLSLFHPVIFKRLPFSVFGEVCVLVDESEEMARLGLLSQTQRRQTWQCVWPPAATIHSHNNLIYPING